MGLIALLGVLIAVPFSFADDSDGASINIDGSSDLAAELEKAVSGDILTLTANKILYSEATLKSGVTLNDGGFSLVIYSQAALRVEGELNSTGTLTVSYNGSLVVAYGGRVFIDNKAEVTGYLDVRPSGNLYIGNDKSSSFVCDGTGKLNVDGLMVLGRGSINSEAVVRNSTVTGELRISEGSTFRVKDVLTFGSAPTLIESLKNDAAISGRVTLESTAYIMVYGDSTFTKANIKYSSSNTPTTQFIIRSNVFATLYTDDTGKHALVFPTTSELRDYRLVNWKDAAGNIITAESGIQIGSPGFTKIDGEVEKRTYRIFLSEDLSIRWVVNGITKGSSGEEEGVYGATYTIGVMSPSGAELPALFKDGVAFANGESFDIKGDTTFTTANNYPEPEKSMVPLLLIAIGFVFLIVLALGYFAFSVKGNKK